MAVRLGLRPTSLSSMNEPGSAAAAHAQKAADEKETVRLQNKQMRLENKAEVRKLEEEVAALKRQVERLRKGGFKVKEQWELLLMQSTCLEPKVTASSKLGIWLMVRSVGR